MNFVEICRSRSWLGVPVRFRLFFYLGWALVSLWGGTGLLEGRTNFPQQMWGEEGAVPYQPRHHLHRIFTPELFVQEPEVFPMYGGVRFQPRAGFRDWQPCLGNPRTAEIAAEAARDYFRENPEAVSFPLGTNDSIRFCECEKCQADIDYENPFRRRPDASALVFGFMNRVAEELEEEYPDRYLTALAYLWAENTPPFAVHPQVMPYLTADRPQWFDADFQEEDRDLMERWSRAGPRQLGIYDYYYGGSFLIPRMFWRSMEKSLNHAYELGVVTVFTEIAPYAWDLTKEEVVRRKILEPERTVDDILEEVSGERYGRAADEMVDFYRWAEENWREGSALRRQLEPQGEDPGLGIPYWIRGFRQIYQMRIFSAGEIEQGQGYLDRAWAMREDLDSGQLENLRRVREGYRIFVLYWTWYDQILKVSRMEEGAEDGSWELSLVWALGEMLGSSIDRLPEDRESNNLRRTWNSMKYQPLRNLSGPRLANPPGLSADERIWERISERYSQSGLMESREIVDRVNEWDGDPFRPLEDGDDGWLVSSSPVGRKNSRFVDGEWMVGPGARLYLFRRYTVDQEKQGRSFLFGVEAKGRLSRGALAEIQVHFFDQQGGRLELSPGGSKNGFSDEWRETFEPLYVGGRIPDGAAWVLYSVEAKDLADGDGVTFRNPRLYLGPSGEAPSP